MKVELFPFQQKACSDLRIKAAEALGEYQRTHAAQVISFTAPTGAGKTIIMAAMVEDILFGGEGFSDQQEAIFVWLSDSPELNKQSKLKFDLKADRIRLGQCVIIEDDSFDQEMLDDGHIYFLNTQKLGKSSNLTKQGDARTYTIWETLANTAREKSDRLYFIIDEAHRGMQGRKAGEATTIMQKFIKGSVEDEIPPMPVVIGMSATMERFNKLVQDTSSTIRKCVVTSDEVRASGLLKDRIVITYPEDNMVGKEMAVLQAAADDWKQKWDHWTQYCQEQHYAYVNPVFVIQVLNASGDKISDTDLDDCLKKIEDRTGFRFDRGEVVHTFGQPESSLQINGLEVPYEEPSRISDDRNIKVVFFKENLSTGWDCPRAETMMSFRHAVDATYIAQLLGRMIRTPMQAHIQVDDILNDVHLYLPYFDTSTVKQVVDALQSSEGGDIPADIYSEGPEDKPLDTLTIHPRKSHKKKEEQVPGQMRLEDYVGNEQSDSLSKEPVSVPRKATQPEEEKDVAPSKEPVSVPEQTVHPEKKKDVEPAEAKTKASEEKDAYTLPEHTTDAVSDQDIEEPLKETEEEEGVPDSFDREAIVKFINDSGLLTYNVRHVQINNYLTSLFRMAHFLTQFGLYPDAVQDVDADIVQMIREYVDDLKERGLYEDLVTQVKQFELQVQIFDMFGESVDNYSVHDLITSTDTDIDRQFRLAEGKLGGEGVGNEYGRRYIDQADPYAFKIDVILFAADSECIEKLYSYAEKKYHELNDGFRRHVAAIDSEKIHRQYDNIVSDGDIVSKHNFRLPEIIQVPHDSGGKEYSDHLFVNEETGTAKIRLNTWEEGVLAEEEAKDDFVCWIRNPSRGSWALTIPYEYNTTFRSAYPDLIIVRKDDDLGYILDVLEPHRPDLDDNLGKARGFAEYARQNPGIGRIQLIRMAKDVANRHRFKRLDLSQSATRDRVLRAITQDELNRLFDEFGFFEDNK